MWIIDIFAIFILVAMIVGLAKIAAKLALFGISVLLIASVFYFFCEVIPNTFHL
jgi:hypothetical protein